MNLVRLNEWKKHLFFRVQLRVKIIINKLGDCPMFVSEKAPQLNNQNNLWRWSFQRKNVSWNLLQIPVKGVCTSMLYNNNIGIRCNMLYNQTKKYWVTFCFVQQAIDPFYMLRNFSMAFIFHWPLWLYRKTI